MLEREGGAREFNDTGGATMHFEQVTLIPAGHAGYKLVMLLPPH